MKKENAVWLCIGICAGMSIANIIYGTVIMVVG